MRISDMIIPVMIAVILLNGMRKKIDVFSVFTDGAKDGLQTSFRILPALIGLMTCIGMLKASGAVDIFCTVLEPFSEKLGIPPEVLPLALFRPLSGSGSLSICQQILTEYGPDSPIGRIASILQSSGETTFYIVSLYYGSIGVSRTRHAIPSALFGDLVCILASCWIIRIFF